VSAPVVDARALATRLVCLRILRDAIAKADTATRAALQSALLVGDRATAAVTGVDGQPVPVGTVTATKGAAGKVTAAVTDMDALAQWCLYYAPDEVQTVTIVRPAFQRRLLDVVKASGGWPDEDTGEVHRVWGVNVSDPTPGAPGLMVKPTETADAEVRAAWADGRLRFADLTEITDGAP
jgi:hypothetical protein